MKGSRDLILDYLNLHTDVFLWAIATQGLAVLNLLHYVQTFLYLAEYGVLVVEERSATSLGISFHLFFGEPRITLLFALRLGLVDELVL